MQNSDPYQDRTFRAYYNEVGKHSILSASEEYALLLRYKTCPACSKRLPHLVRNLNCPKCGDPTKPRVPKRLTTCESCHTRFETKVPPSYCPYCASERDTEAREQLIVSNLRFVMTTARKISKKPAHLQRLVSAGNVGLIIALDKFDLKIKTRFLTYAAWWIRKEMFDEIHRSSLVHIPSHKQKATYKARRYGVYECVHCSARVDSLKYLEEEAIPHCTEEEHQFVVADTNDPISSITSIDKITIQAEQDIETDTISTNASVLLRNVLRKLPIRHRDLFIVLQYYNMAQDDRRTEAKSLPQLSQITGITPERVRQIKEKVLLEAKKELVRQTVNQSADIHC